MLLSRLLSLWGGGPQQDATQFGHSLGPECAPPFFPLQKPFLGDKEKRILMVVVPLQVFANIAIIITDEESPSIKDWFTWRDMFHLVDIICCCAILFPIVWSIKHLREASHTDGKAARNLEKLTLFRQFYVMVSRGAAAQAWGRERAKRQRGNAWTADGSQVKEHGQPHGGCCWRSCFRWRRARAGGGFSLDTPPVAEG